MRDDEIVKEVKLDWLDKSIISFLICFFVWLLSGCSGITPAPTEDPNAVIDCRTETSPLPPPFKGGKGNFGTDDWSYCFTKGNGKTTLYYLHGFTDSQHAWQQANTASYDAQLQALKKSLGTDAPDVVAISYVPTRSLLKKYTSFILSAPDYRSMYPQLARLDHLISTVVPLMEKRYSLTGRPRIIWGMSQSGGSAANLCFRHPEMWQKCIIQHPLVITCDGWNIFDTSCLGAPLVRFNFANQQEYDLTDPFKIIDSIDPAKLPKVFLSAADGDVADFLHGDFNLFPPDKALMSRLVLRGVTLKWQVDHGGHSDFDPQPIIEFLKTP